MDWATESSAPLLASHSPFGFWVISVPTDRAPKSPCPATHPTLPLCHARQGGCKILLPGRAANPGEGCWSLPSIESIKCSGRVGPHVTLPGPSTSHNATNRQAAAEQPGDSHFGSTPKYARDTARIRNLSTRLQSYMLSPCTYRLVSLAPSLTERSKGGNNYLLGPSLSYPVTKTMTGLELHAVVVFQFRFG